VSPLLQTLAAWLFIIWFLPRIRSANTVTTNTWLFVGLFSLATALQIEAVYDGVDSLVGISHFSWLASYVTGLAAFYSIYKALCVMLNPARPEASLWFYRGLVLVIGTLLILFPAITAEPDFVAPGNLATLLFFVVPYTYAAVISYTLCWMLYRCQNSESPLHLKVRWQLLSVVVFLGAGFFALRVPHLVLLHLHPDFAHSQTSQAVNLLLNYLTITRIGWVLFFIPDRVYQAGCRPLMAIRKLLAWRELDALRIEANTLLARHEVLEVSYSWPAQLRNLDLLLYRTLISILDIKRMLTDTLREECVDGNRSEQAMRLHQVLGTIDDGADFDTLVCAYERAGRQYRRYRPHPD
jgi:hypothetical protein